MSGLHLFAIFHLNLAYSSIEQEQHADVVARCYHPLLDLVERGFPLGIEATAFTLQVAAEADSSWLARLRSLLARGACEFVGAGYAQLIGPLVPPEVNAANLRLGDAACEDLLGVRPALGLVNEQAYSAGLLRHFLDAGYESLFMEWDNPARFNPSWAPEWRYLPQVACGQHGERLPVLFNLATAFQKLQRFAHGELPAEEYLSYVLSHRAETPRAFPLYGNDAEVLDFRPGRYATEAAIVHGEWDRVGDAFERLAAEPDVAFAAPSEVLRELAGKPGAGNELHLETPELPVPVKKQGKYNLTRWAVTGRADLAINTRCWRAYERLRDDGGTDDDWRELCDLWSSDFRTHITDARWTRYLERLAAFERRVGAVAAPSRAMAAAEEPAGGVEIERNERFVTVTTPHVRVRASLRRGLAIESLAFPALGDDALVGTLPHGYYDDISMTADYYTGHAVLEPVGEHKVTDLGQVDATVAHVEDGITLSGRIDTPLGPVTKRLHVSSAAPRIEIAYAFDWPEVPRGSLRLGHVTLMPDAFDRETLFYATHNGGAEERFALAGSTIDQGAPVSLLVTASTALGVTGGVVRLGDARRALRVEVDKSAAALVGLMTYRDVAGSLFCRLAFSALEVDETRKPQVAGVAALPGEIRVVIAAEI